MAGLEWSSGEKEGKRQGKGCPPFQKVLSSSGVWFPIKTLLRDCLVGILEAIFLLPKAKNCSLSFFFFSFLKARKTLPPRQNWIDLKWASGGMAGERWFACVLQLNCPGCGSQVILTDSETLVWIFLQLLSLSSCLFLLFFLFLFLFFDFFILTLLWLMGMDQGLNAC